MSVQSISVANQAFRMTEEEVITFEFDFTKLVMVGVTANGQQSRIIDADSGIDVSDDCLLGAPQRTGNVVSQVVENIQRYKTYVLILTILLSNSNKRSATITIEGYV